jgi:hypothetical protein
MFALAMLSALCPGSRCGLVRADAPVASKSAAKTPAENVDAEKANVEQANSAAKNQKPVTVVKVTPAREAAAVTFAGRHHPELAELLAHLKKKNRPEYTKAVAELFRTSERLAKLEERDQERHELVLQLWKLDSRIRLLAARMTMSKDVSLKDELKGTLFERNTVRLQLLSLDRDRLQGRIDKVNENIDELSQDREGQVARELERLKKLSEPRKQEG